MNNTSMRNPLDPNHRVSLDHFSDPNLLDMESDAIVDCGWGRLLFNNFLNEATKLRV